MENKKTVVVIFGGISTEHKVSCLSATSVLNNLDSEKYEVLSLGITEKGEWLLYTGDVSLIKNDTWFNSPSVCPAILSPDAVNRGLLVKRGENWVLLKVDVVFPVLHGLGGEDGTIQGLCELANIPYVGCGVMASANCMDKDVTKRLLNSKNVPTAKGITVYAEDIADMDSVCQRMGNELGWPVFVKPVNLGSSVGVSRAENPEEFRKAIELAFSFDRKVLVEEFIDGAEVECAVMGNHINAKASEVIGEIVPLRGLYDYEGKYLDGTTALYIPARLPEKQTELLRKTALKAYQALDCKGLARVDFFALPDGSVILNEINTLPGFTDISMFPKLFMESGYTYSSLLDQLIEYSLEGKNHGK